MSRGRTAMRVAAVVWLATTLLGIAIDLWQQSIWDEHEAGAELDAILERMRNVGWFAHAAHALGTATVVFVASAWAKGRPLVRVGQGLLALSLLVAVWLVVVRMGQSTIADLESLAHVGIANGIAFYVGLALLLAPTRAPIAARVGFVVLSVGWLVYLHVLLDPATALPMMWVFSAVQVLISTCWCAGLWLAAPHEIDDEIDAAVAEGVDDPARLRAADGIAVLRAAMIARIVLTISAVAMLVAVRADPGAASMLVWLAAFAHCVLAAVIANALTRYGSLPDAAVERGHLTTVVACLAIAAMLELYGATQTAALLDIVGRANAGDLSNFPGLTELESMQSRAQWVGRIATVVGIVAAVSLAISLRKTALWLDDFKSGDRASALAVLTILGGGFAGVLVAVAQSGAIRDLGTMAALMLAALTCAIAILVMWLRLLGSLRDGLSRGRRA